MKNAREICEQYLEENCGVDDGPYEVICLKQGIDEGAFTEDQALQYWNSFSRGGFKNGDWFDAPKETSFGSLLADAYAEANYRESLHNPY